MLSKLTTAALFLAAFADGRRTKDTQTTQAVTETTTTVGIVNPELVFDFTQDASLFDTLEVDGVDLQVGQTATFVLQENPSTGYTWLIDSDASNGAFSFSSVVNETSSGMIGAPTTREITVSGKVSSAGVLHAAYVRPWEFTTWSGSYNAAQEFTIPVAIL